MESIDINAIGLVFLSVAIIFASMITSVTGMAGGVLMFSAMSIYMPVMYLVPIHGVVQLFNNTARAWFLRSHIRYGMCIPFGIGAAIGAAATTIFIVKYIGELFPLVILVALILYTLFKPSRIPHFEIKDKNFFWVGCATGSLGIIAGAIDPLLAVFFFRDDMSKEEIVCNKSVMQIFAHATKIPAFLFLGFSFIDNAPLIIFLSVIAIFGARIGILLLKIISKETFVTLMKIALFLSAIRIIYQIYNIIGV